MFGERSRIQDDICQFPMMFGYEEVDDLCVNLLQFGSV
jgi:hypothetical protein